MKSILQRALENYADDTNGEVHIIEVDPDNPPFHKCLGILLSPDFSLINLGAGIMGYAKNQEEKIEISREMGNHKFHTTPKNTLMVYWPHIEYIEDTSN